jgi:phage terminase large subunit GpA-like protein
MPDSVVEIDFKFNQIVKDLKRSLWKEFEVEEKLSVTQWADTKRKLPESSALSGQWQTSWTPYLKGPMDAFSDPHIREIVMMFSTQVGKTESMLNMVGWTADCDPGPSAWIGPDEITVKEFCVERIQPLFDLSDDLIKRLSSNKDEINKHGIRLDRMRLHILWAGSPARLSSRPIRYMFRDELDKWPRFSGREADPVELSNERLRTYKDIYKAVDVSTPTTKEGYIHKAYEKTDKRKYYVPCPHCGHYQILLKKQIKVPEHERDTDKIRLLKLAWYECEECGEKIFDRHKHEMLINGQWVPDGCTIDKEGVIHGEIPKTDRAGFWLNALYSPWLTFSDIIAKWFEVCNDPPKLMNFINSWLAEVWEERTKETRIDVIQKRCADYEKEVVPDAALVLTAAIDTQDYDSFYLTIRAWGYDQESWLIKEEKIYGTWDDIELIVLNTGYQKADGTTFFVRLAIFDTGGHRTAEVYDFCRKHPDRCRAIKGQETLHGEMFRVRKLDKYPNGKSIPGGLDLWHIDSNFFKDRLHSFIHADDNAKHQWHIYKNPSREYFNHMVNEKKVPKRDLKTGRVKSETWQPISGSVRVDYWDCENYQMAAAQMLYLNLLVKPTQPAAQQAEQQENNNKNASWIGQRSNWINRNG